MTDQEKLEAHILDKYQIVKKLGSGAYGHVWKAKNKATGTVVALKKIFDAFQHSTDAQRTFREISVLRQLRHEKIINLLDVLPSLNNLDIYLIFEYMESDLYRLVYDGELQSIHIKYITYQIMLGLHYLHSSRLIHRDLKPSNILLNRDCSTKICDFGLVRYLDNESIDSSTLTEGVATRWYRSPQVLLGSNSYDTKADMWSVGCILAEILLKNPLFPGNSTTNQLERILQFTGQPSASDIKSLHAELAEVMISQVSRVKSKKKADFFAKVSNEELAIDLIYSLLEFDPSKRLDTAQALQHRYFSEFYNEKDLEVSASQIIMEVNESTRLKSEKYLEIIKQKFISSQDEARSKSGARKRTSESPKCFSDLKKSRVSSQSSNSRANQNGNREKSLHRFKQLCRQKSSRKKESRSPSKQSSNKENEAQNRGNKQKFQTFSSYAGSKFGDKKGTNSNALKKTSRINQK